MWVWGAVCCCWPPPQAHTALAAALLAPTRSSQMCLGWPRQATQGVIDAPRNAAASGLEPAAAGSSRPHFMRIYRAGHESKLPVLLTGWIQVYPSLQSETEVAFRGIFAQYYNTNTYTCKHVQRRGCVIGVFTSDSFPGL